MKNAKCKVQKLKRSLSKDKRAVSPVIGVILMVAITVILAAVIAAFVFGYGTPTKAPQASLIIIKASTTDGYLLLAHQGGDSAVIADLRAIWTHDVSDPTDAEALGSTAMTEEFFIGAVADGVFQSGERMSITPTAGLTEGETGELVLIHVPSGQQIVKTTVTATA